MKRPFFLFTGILLCLAACSASEEDDAASGDSAYTTQGEWGPQVGLRDGDLYVTPIHTTLLPSGKIFVTGWSRVDKENCRFPEGSRRDGISFVLDPKSVGDNREIDVASVAENVTARAPWKAVLYCAGHVPVTLGDETAVLLTGGSRYLFLGQRDQEIEEGLRQVHLAFADRAQPAIELLSDGLKTGPLCRSNDGQELLPGEAQARGGKWYATNTRLPDGRVLVTGGFTGGPRSSCIGGDQRHSASAETFDPTTRTFTALFQPEDLPNGFGERFAPGDKDYTHTILLPTPIEKNGHRYSLAMMGYAGVMVLLDVEPGTPARERFYFPPNGSRPGDVMAWDSTMALVSTGEILVMGGTNDAGIATRIDLYDPMKDTWRSVDTGVGRRNAGATLLPDGRVLVINGWRDDSAALGRDERTRPLVFDPEATDPAKKLVELDAFAGDRERGYHSFALLAKDASILVGGGVYPSTANGDTPKESDIGCERTDVQRWKPPYLAANNVRPVVSSTRIDMKVGGPAVEVPFSGATLHATKGAALMALGSFTHGFDQNQRYVRLAFEAKDGSVVLTPPKTASIAPPGDFMLFLVSNAGVPSVGVHVRLSL
jgi:hypothetical protein